MVFYYILTRQEYEEATDLYNYRARHYAQRRGHFLAPDPQGQFHSPYVYAGNNPVNLVDPDGEFALGWIPILTRATTYVSEIANSLVQGRSIGDGLRRGNQAIGITNSATQFPIYSSGNTTISIGVSIYDVSAGANVHYTNGNTTYSGGLGIGLSGSFSSAGVTYQQGDFSIGAGAGGDSNHIGFGANAGYGEFGAGYYLTQYGDAIGPDGASNRQLTGGVNLSFPGNVGFRIENDFFAFQKQDRWRTSAVELNVNGFLIGTNVFTNDPPGDIVEDHEFSLFGPNSAGTYADGEVYSSPLYVGMVQRGYATRVGINHPVIQDLTQNLIHSLKQVPYFRTPYGRYFSPYVQSGIYNPYSLYK